MDTRGGGNSSGPGDDNRCPCGRQLDMVGVHVTPTTGGQFELRVASTDSVDFLRRLVSKRLRVPKERICLLYRDRHLREGTLIENSILDGARITLLPSVETGLLTQRPEQSVMQALESLNDGQVNDFLTGKAPLNLTMRLGDHMMLIQLQLSTVSPTGSRTKSRVPSTHTQAQTHTHTQAQTHTHTNAHTQSSDHQAHPHPSTHPLTPPYTPHMSAGGCSGYTPVHTTHLSTPSHTSHTSPTKLTLNPSQPSLSTLSTSASSTSYPSASQQSPTPSSPTATPPHHHYLHHHRSSSSHSFSGSSSPSSPPPPYLSTPPHHHHHNHNHNHHHHHHLHRHHCHTSGSTSPSSSPSSSVGSPSTSGGGLSWDSDLPIRGCPHRGDELDPRASLDTKALAEASRNLTQTLKQLSSEVLTSKPESKEESLINQDLPKTSSVRQKCSESSNNNSSCNNSSSSSNCSGSSNNSGNTNCGITSNSNTSSPSTSSSGQTAASYNSSKKQGAIIESMHHHGKGVYSGTFSGTLNPALQDRHGRPKRDISTIIHILNDLLCATPQYRRHTASISLSTSTPSNPTNSYKSKPSSNNKTSTFSTTASEHQQLLLQQEESRRHEKLPTQDHKYKESTAIETDIDENTAMRNKLEEIRSKLEQRRARRKARREQRASPYPCTTSWSSETTTIPNSIATGTTSEVSSPGGSSSTQAMEVEASETGEQQDQAHLCQLNSETVVA